MEPLLVSADFISMGRDDYVSPSIWGSRGAVHGEAEFGRELICDYLSFDLSDSSHNS